MKHGEICVMDSPAIAAAPVAPRKNAYSSPPWWYDVRGFMILNLSYRSTLGAQVKFFAKNIGRRHLEVAIGTGTLFKMVLRRARRNGNYPQQVIGVDYAAEMLKGARGRFGSLPEFTLSQQDVTQMSLPDSSFETINVANALHCFADVPAALAEMRRVLVPGGTLAVNALLYPQGFAPLRKIANAVNAWGMRKGILHSPFNRDEVLAHFFRAGFHVESAELSGNCLFIVARKQTEN
jgi:ubiquinone/menaquinone biosynthesis C-methylase UbiE